ncbi:MAG: rhomboid family intramembrane serine protease [Bacteroidia bacterium]|nr:rhomboid family intramembrane serine protease [Bacteroidia bacterium]MDW8157964.1 rhomboid family intramembrane serine protease [Bacteroidia bacterium]
MQLRITPAVLNLIIINFLIWLASFAICKISYHWFTDLFLCRSTLVLERPSACEFKLYQLLTSFFIHDGPFLPNGGFGHIFFNMLFLFFIGPPIEEVIGTKRFIFLYLFVGIVGCLITALLDPLPYPSIGSSVATSGIFLVLAAYYPDMTFILFPIPIPIKAKYFLLGYATLTFIFLLQSLSNPQVSQGSISHFSHLAGMFAGWLYMQVEKYTR